MTVLGFFMLGVVGLVFGLVNKLPDRFYEGEARMAKRLRCAFCTGVFVGLWAYPIWGIPAEAYGLCAWWEQALLWPSFAGGVGALAGLLQFIGKMSVRDSE